MISQREINDRFNDIEESVKNDDEIMLKILLDMFGDVRGLWDVIHQDVTLLSDDMNPNNELREECLESLEASYDEIMNEITERELLDSEIIDG